MKETRYTYQRIDIMNKPGIFLIFLFIVLNTWVYAQVKIPTGTIQQVNKFLNTTTYVVLENEILSDFNISMREAVEDFWTITPFEFIRVSDFHRERYDEDKSFLVVNQVYFDRDRSNSLFDFLILTIGGNARTINDMPSMAAAPLSYNGAPASSYDYKMGLIIKFLQNHILAVKENPQLNEDNVADFYLENSGSVQDKTFYVLREDLEQDIRNRATFSREYPHNFEFADKEKIKNLIDQSDPDGIILHKVGPPRGEHNAQCFKIVLDTKNASVYFYDMHGVNNRNPDALLKRDLRTLSQK